MVVASVGFLGGITSSAFRSGESAGVIFFPLTLKSHENQRFGSHGSPP